LKTIIDVKKIRKRSILSNIMSIGGLITLLASVILPLFIPSLANLSFLLMVAGLGVSMVGIYFANRWVRKPRPEDQLNKALKSLNDSYHLYHYPSLPCDHVLLTPSGVVILETVGLSGAFTYKKGKWKESMTIGRALRWIVEEHLGNPIRAALDAEGYLRREFEKLDISDTKIPIKPVVVFIHPVVELDIEGAAIPVCKLEKLRKHIPSDTPRLEVDLYNHLDDFFINLTKKS
jgi:hypothetical protein